jgi:hypothetical protein
MGFKVAWVAVKGKSSDAVVSDLDLERTGEHEAFPESEYCIVTMPRGWVVVVNCFSFGSFILEAPLDRVKRGAEVLTCYVNETTMTSDLGAYENGALLWSVTHDSEKGADDLRGASRTLRVDPRRACRAAGSVVRRRRLSVRRRPRSRRGAHRLPTRQGRRRPRTGTLRVAGTGAQAAAQGQNSRPLRQARVMAGAGRAFLRATSPRRELR